MITCPDCGRTSHNPNDEEQGWCGACDRFTGEVAFVLRGREPLLAYVALTSLLVIHFADRAGRLPSSLDVDGRALADRLERHLELRLRRGGSV